MPEESPNEPSVTPNGEGTYLTAPLIMNLAAPSLSRTVANIVKGMREASMYRPALPVDLSPETIGTVTHNEAGDRVFANSRLIINRGSYSMKEQNGPSADGPEVRIQLRAKQYEQTFASKMPYLLGFTAVAVERSLNGDYNCTYIETPDNDPYINANAMATRAISSSQISELCDVYRTEGAIWTAQRLEDGVPNLGSLRDSLRESGLYNRPDPGASKEELAINLFQGRIVGQCLNFAALLARDVNRVMPGHTAEVIGGYAISSEITTAMGHAQTMVTDQTEGAVAVFDATPGLTLQEYRLPPQSPFLLFPYGA